MLKTKNKYVETSRERPKWASYLRLNNNQGKIQPIVKFFIHHTEPKNPERLFPETRKALETLIKLICLREKLKFFKKVFGKKSRTRPKNPKRDPLGSLKLDLEFKNFRKKSSLVPKKNQKGDSLVYSLLFWKH